MTALFSMLILSEQLTTRRSVINTTNIFFLYYIFLITVFQQRFITINSRQLDVSKQCWQIRVQ